MIVFWHRLGARPLNRLFSILFGATAKKYAAGGNQQSVNPARYKRRQTRYFKARSATAKKYAAGGNRQLPSPTVQIQTHTQKSNKRLLLTISENRFATAPFRGARAKAAPAS